MHLFVIHQYADFDNFSPVIFNLKKNNEEVLILNIYPINDFQKLKVGKFLNENKIPFFNLSDINFKNKILRLLIFFLFKFFYSKIEKCHSIFYFIYHKLILFSSKELSNFLKKNKIKTISYDTSLPNQYMPIINNTKRYLDIKIFKYKIAIELRKNINVYSDEVTNCDYLILADSLSLDKLSFEEKKKIVILKSLRFSKNWIDKIYKIFNLKNHFLNYKNNSPLKILILHRPLFSIDIWDKIVKGLSLINNCEVVFKKKPRGVMPVHLNNKRIEDLTSSELVNWADLIVTQSTTIILEAAIKKKKIFYLDFLMRSKMYQKKNTEYSKEKYIFENYPFINMVNSMDDLIEKVEKLQVNRDSFEYNYQDVKFFFNKELEYDFENNNFNDYLILYNKLSKKTLK